MRQNWDFVKIDDYQADMREISDSAASVVTTLRADKSDLTRTEYGSVEAVVVGTITHYGRPALQVRLRLTGDLVKCVVSQDAVEKIGLPHSWYETWSNQRVLIMGEIHYNEEGKIARIEAKKISVIEDKIIPIDEVRGQSQSTAFW